MLRPSRAADVLLVSLLLAILSACVYAGYAAWHIYYPPSSCQSWKFPPLYKLRAEDVGTKDALMRGLLWCSAPQAAAAVLTLLLVDVGIDRRCCLAVAFVALAATAANHYMYGKLLGLARVNAPGDFFLALETAYVFLAALLDLLGVLALIRLLLLGAGLLEEEQGRASKLAKQA
ncbi:hypothetical protein EJB05_21034 [Eragrostis curvula]|uniref:EXPERA domain-containing protein n=1 Tax=Eragrostis curvula TaxID=38414 RepID=A0A5J9V1W9_9POAL|nr:hypothetical protein EJB05_21034 [Eragrostis curvula]